MKLSTRMRYGTRAMVELARRYGKGPISLTDIARRQGLSDKYLEALLASLRNAGLVRSVRGAQGGYLLANPPERINLRQVFEALEGSEAYVYCTQDPNLCERADRCVTQGVWARMYRASMDVLESTTLADLSRRVEAPASPAALSYQI